MTYLQILNIIKETALAQPNVHSVVREFLDLNREDAEYSAVVIQDRDGQRERVYEQDWVTYTWHLGYVDRLTYDEGNRDDIYSTGINVINNIVNNLRNKFDMEVNVVDRFTTFNQRFTAQCAGVYIVLAVEVPLSDCDEGVEVMPEYDVLVKRFITNGEFHLVPEGRPWNEADIVVDVHPTEKLTGEITSNGVYTDTGEWKDAEIMVSVHPSESLSRTYTRNSTYTETGEWKDASITVDVHPTDTLDDWVTENAEYRWTGDFKNARIRVSVHPSISLSRTYTSNGTFRETGEWKDAMITVAVPAAKEEESLVETITSNGEYSYSPSAGKVFSSVSIAVSVPEQKVEEMLVETITENGEYDYLPSADNSVFSEVMLSVDVHPSQSLSRTYTTNGTKTINGEFNGGTINISVHPSQRLEKTYINQGTYNVTGEWKDATITVGLPTPADDEIYYTSYTDDVIIPTDLSDMGVNLVSNTYGNGYGILKFDGPVTKVGNDLFFGQLSLRTISLPSQCETIRYRSFCNTGLVYINMGNSVREIQGYAFSGCFALVSPMRLSDLLADIGYTSGVGASFSDCTALQTVTIRSLTLMIGPGIWNGCKNLSKVIVQATIPPLLMKDSNDQYSQFFNNAQGRKIYVPAESLNNYLSAPGWSDYAADIVAL